MSIDGGGVKGLITAEIVKAVEERRPGFLQKFDCFVGSSSGAIVSSLYASEHTAEQAVDIFEEKMDKIFAVHWKKRVTSLNGILCPIYEKSNLYDACSSIITDCAFSELNKSLLIWSFDLVEQQPYLYMNVKQLNPEYDKIKYTHPTQYVGYLHDAVFSSCLAPTYFMSDSGLTDGGIFANNPAAISLTTLYKQDDTMFERGVMLSIGYNDNPERLKIDGGTLTWLQASRTLMHANMTQGKYIPENILGDRFFRIEVGTKVGLDSIKSKKQLKEDAAKWVDKNMDAFLAWVDKYIMN